MRHRHPADFASAALERARRRRESLDREIVASLERDAEEDAGEFGIWSVTMSDGLE